MRAIAARGHEVHFVTQDPLLEPLDDCATIEKLPFSGYAGYYLNAWRLKSIIRRVRPDILHVNYASGYGTLGRRARSSAPTVLTVWGSDVVEVPERSAWYRRTITANLRAADVITTASDSLAGYVRALDPKADVHIVPFGVDTGKFTPGPAPARSARITIGTVKNLDSVYGIDLLIRAFRHLRDTGTESRPELLVIGGAGPEEARLKALAVELGVADVVQFRGRVAHDDVPALLRTFNAYAALSRQESFGVAVAEASACGIPVVAARVGGLPEVVEDGITGYLVSPENVAEASAAIARILLNPPLADRMGKAGRDFVIRNFDWESCVDRMMQIYMVAAPGGVTFGG